MAPLPGGSVSSHSIGGENMRSMAGVYDSLAKVYDIPFGRVFAEGRRRTIDLLDLQPGHRVLELGVGTGLTLPLYPPDVQVVAIDISQAMLQGAIHRVEESHLENVHFSLQDATHLGFRDHSFDRVTAFYVMSVVPDPHQTLLEMARVVKPGGKIIFVNHFQRERGFLSWLEWLFSPIFQRLGFRTDLKVSQVINGQGAVQVVRIEGVNFLNYWSLIECVPATNGHYAMSRPSNEEL